MSVSQTKTLFVFQTRRKLLKFLSENQNTLLHAVTLSELVEKVVLVKDRAKISKSAQIALLKKAVDRVDIGVLGFAKSFLDFLGGSDFLFSFFEELRSEEKTIDDIRGEDLYAAFEDHLEVLEELFAAYKDELSKVGAYDFISMEKWDVNDEYLQNFEEARVESMGLFSNFELSVLLACAGVVQTNLLFTIDRYNKKMSKKFAAIGVDISVKEGSLHIDLSAKKLISVVSSKEAFYSHVETFRLKNRVYQAPFAMSQIAELLNAGAPPEGIAIILPDESFAPLLKLFDRDGNLNFAFGESFFKTRLFSAFDALLLFAMGEKNGRILESLGVLSFANGFLPLCEADGFAPLKKAVETFLEFELWSEAKYGAHKEMFLRELYLFHCEESAYEGMRSCEVGRIFASSLGVKKIDDTSGGKIRVMGALESRGIELDAAIVLDMNEEFFPRKLDKDLFLNTKIREKAGIPTMEDRQNLQKHYFLELIAKTKKCVFAFLENDEAAPSPFLYELGSLPIDVDEESLEGLYFNKIQREKKEPITYDDSQNLYEQYIKSVKKRALSVSGFCDYLRCDKLFYFRHVKRLKKESITEDNETAKDIGTAIHKALERAFNAESLGFKDEDLLRDFVYEQASVAVGEELRDNFEFLFALSQMGRFFENEIERQKCGYSVYAVEKSVLGDIGGVTFDARIDRIDRQNGEFCVIDYKIVSKEIKADSEKAAADSYKYQLALYVLLLQREGIDAKSAYYYDVLRGALVLEGAMETKLGSLEAHIERFLSKPQFLGAKDKKSCIYCDFKTLCGAGGDTPGEDGDEE